MAERAKYRQEIQQVSIQVFSVWFCNVGSRWHISQAFESRGTREGLLVMLLGRNF